MPKELGGLGVADLRRAGMAFRARWVWQDRRLGRPESTITERGVLALAQAAMAITLGDGRSVLFWTDRWLNGTSISSLAPTLFLAVRQRKRRSTVAESLPLHTWATHLSGAFAMQMVVEAAALFDLLEQVQLQDTPDTFCWTLSPDGNYSAASAYGAMFLGSTIPLGAKQIWKTAAPPRVRFFFWLVLHGRCWTADRRFRHGLQPTDTCILCDQESETIDHILLGCVFSREVWHRCLRWAQLDGLNLNPAGNAIPWWLAARKLIPQHRRKGFDSLFFLVGWRLWKERNKRTFDDVPTNALQLASQIQEEAELWCLAALLAV